MVKSSDGTWMDKLCAWDMGRGRGKQPRMAQGSSLVDWEMGISLLIKWSPRGGNPRSCFHHETLNMLLRQLQEDIQGSGRPAGGGGTADAWEPRADSEWWKTKTSIQIKLESYYTYTQLEVVLIFVTQFKPNNESCNIGRAGNIWCFIHVAESNTGNLIWSKQ